ncbi:MAG: tRNA (adenosine(37)-N6)-threonylcarbamoyltransferase complex dimerization subunit type 1 TsaB [Cytophagales bacterium]
MITPIILAIETSAKVCSVSLNVDSKPLATYETFVEKSSSELIKVYSDRILNDHQLSYKDLSAVAVSKGPGSYTGLRIGVSFSKGLCFALDIPLIGINTLKALALQIKTHTKLNDLFFVPMLDARRMEVYTASFDDDLNFINDTEAVVLNPLFFEKFNPNKTLFFGDGAIKVKQFITENNRFEILENIYPSAKQIGILAYESYLKSAFENTAYFEPFYLKPYFSDVSQKTSLNL